jgi:hypothetical protein
MEVVELQRASAMADARLNAAEQMGWLVAVFGGAVVWLALNWWLALIAFYPIYWFSTSPFRREAFKAEENYFKAAKIGRYIQAKQQGLEK